MADVDFQDFIARVKRANPIEDVIEETGGPEFKLRRRTGNYLTGEVHDSFKVRVDEGYYFWNANQGQGERGDVFNWLEKRKNMDFWSALQWLAERAHLEMPLRFKPSEESQAKRLAAKVREETWQVAQQVFASWLLKDAPALEYVTDKRGWSAETIAESGVGFAGRATAAEFAEMRGELTLHSIDPESPQAVAILGYKGDVRGWGQSWGVEVRQDWIEWGAIYGMMSRSRLVYAHIEGGRVVYLSGRNILGAEIYKEGGSGGEERVVKSWNPPKELAGPRAPFFNHRYGRGAEECMVVEGQGDAVSLAELGIPAMATLGTSWKDLEGVMEELRKRHKDLYYAGDNDEAGNKTLVGNREKPWPLADVFGPLGRVVVWPHNLGAEAVKDANDYLVTLKGGKLDEDGRVKAVRGLLHDAPTFAECVAGWAGRQKGAEADDAVKRAFVVIGQMDGVLLAKYRKGLARELGLGTTDFNNMLKAVTHEARDENEPGQIVETLGGWVVNKDGQGTLIEYLWDEAEQKSMLAFRGPDGKVDTAAYVDIDDVRYVPKQANSLIRLKAVLFPSKVGQLKSTRELVAIVESFINRNYLLDDRFFGRMAAYYVLLTWLFDCFNAIPYLRAMGDYGSGKSELMKRIGHVCYRMMSTGGAGTAASLFRALDEYRGTAFLDEMDLQDGGDMANDLIKILNMGAMANSPVWRLSEVIREDGTRNYEPTGYNIFGPKLIAMRKDFRDQAVSSRCLTVKLMGKEPMELKARGIKLHLDQEFYDHALAIRNLLVRWRLAKWLPEIAVGEDLMDVEVPARLNQVTMPIKAIAKDDPELMSDITVFVRSLNAELILERSMGLDARVMEALVEIAEGEKYNPYCFTGAIEGYGPEVRWCLTKHVSKVANELMDEMNTDEAEEETEDQRKRKPRGTTSQTVGRIARQQLQLPCRRKNSGYAIILDPIKMGVLKIKYGLVGPSNQVSVTGDQEKSPNPTPEKMVQGKFDGRE